MKNQSCCRTEEQIEDPTCGCGENFNVSEPSQIQNPLNPKKNISDSFLKDLEEKAKSLGIINIAYFKVPKNITYKGKSLEFFNAIVITMPIGMDIINEDAGLKAQKLNDKLYEKFGKATYTLSDELRKSGFGTQVAHPKENLIDLAKLGEKSGIGYKGKSGLIITPELGSRLKIGAILTSIENLPFNNENNHEWVQDYCKKCNSCLKNCPKNALSEDNDSIIYNLNDSLCIGCSQGCTICIKTCPFYLKGYSSIKKTYNKMKEKGLL